VSQCDLYLDSGREKASTAVPPIRVRVRVRFRVRVRVRVRSLPEGKTRHRASLLCICHHNLPPLHLIRV